MTVTVFLGDGFIRVDPSIPELCAQLRYWHKQMERDPATYQQVIRGSYRDCYVTRLEDSDGTGMRDVTITMPGFSQRIIAALHGMNHEVKIVDARRAFPEPNWELALSGLRDYQCECLYTALMAGGGIVACPTGWGKTHIMIGIVRAYSHADLCHRNAPLIVIATPDRDLASQNYDRLREAFPDRDIGLVMSGKHSISDDIQIVTLDSLHHIAITEASILLIDEVHQAATADRAEQLSKACFARRWGMSATPTGRFDGSDLVTEGLVGPLVYRRTYQQGVADGALVPIRVFWLQTAEPTIGIAAYRRYHTRKAKYDHGVERNENQRDQIVEIMRRVPDGMQTLCIMQHTQQMNELVERLPSIRYVHGKTDQADLQEHRQYYLSAVSPSERKALYTRFRRGELRKIMSSYVYKQGVDFPELQVLVQAGGGGSVIAAGQIPGRGSRPSVDKDCAYLVEFWHGWDTQLSDEGKQVAGPILRDDKARKRVYQQLGFEQIWIKRVDELPFLGGYPDGLLRL